MTPSRRIPCRRSLASCRSAGWAGLPCRLTGANTVPGRDRSARNRPPNSSPSSRPTSRTREPGPSVRRPISLLARQRLIDLRRLDGQLALIGKTCQGAPGWSTSGRHAVRRGRDDLHGAQLGVAVAPCDAVSGVGERVDGEPRACRRAPAGRRLPRRILRMTGSRSAARLRRHGGESRGFPLFVHLPPQRSRFLAWRERQVAKVRGTASRMDAGTGARTLRSCAGR